MNTENPTQLADDLGKAPDSQVEYKCTISEITLLATNLQRFLKEPTEQERAKQLAHASSIFAQIELPPFAPANEAEFEDWVDLAAQKLRRQAVCVELFRDAWLTACDYPHIRQDVVEVTITQSCETFVDAVTRKLSLKSSYHKIIP